MTKKVILLMSFFGVAANAQVITQNFGTGANAFSIDFVGIGNPGNVANSGTYLYGGGSFSTGSVNYVYNLGKYEISRDVVLKASNAGGLGISIADLSFTSGGNSPKDPATGISWSDAAKFVNWLNANTGSQVAYKFDELGSFQLWRPGDAGYQSANPFRNSLARFFLPSRDEWYKAAYGSPDGEWFKYPTGSNAVPVDVSGGVNPGTAVYYRATSIGPADITNAGGLSAFETMAQGGNVAEWIESAFDGVNDVADEKREYLGGAWNNTAYVLGSDGRIDTSPAGFIGFRVASVPEPSAVSLLAVGLGGLAMLRRRWL